MDLTKNFINFIDNQKSKSKFFESIGCKATNYQHIVRRYKLEDDYVPYQFIVRTALKLGINFYYFVDPLKNQMYVPNDVHIHNTSLSLPNHDCSSSSHCSMPTLIDKRIVPALKSEIAILTQLLASKDKQVIFYKHQLALGV